MIEEFRKCTGRCGETKPIADFQTTSRKYETASGFVQVYKYRYKKCRACRLEQNRIWRANLKKNNRLKKFQKI